MSGRGAAPENGRIAFREASDAVLIYLDEAEQRVVQVVEDSRAPGFDENAGIRELRRCLDTAELKGYVRPGTGKDFLMSAAEYLQLDIPPVEWALDNIVSFTGIGKACNIESFPLIRPSDPITAELQRWSRDNPHQSMPSQMRDLMEEAFSPMPSPNTMASAPPRMTR